MHNQKDMSRCHCGGTYRINAQTKSERDTHKHYAYCLACGTTRYLSDKEVEMATAAAQIKNWGK